LAAHGVVELAAHGVVVLGRVMAWFWRLFNAVFGVVYRWVTWREYRPQRKVPPIMDIDSDVAD
jgi:hypothetical protein